MSPIADRCFSAIKACRLRIVRLDSCGRPVVGARSVLTSKGFVSVTATADIEEGEEFLVKNACGEPCINEKDCSFLKRYNLEINFCKVDPAGVELTTGQRLVLNDDGDGAGFGLGETIQCDEGFSLELWQKLTNKDCDASGDPEWFYWSFPFLNNGTLGDLTFENGPFSFSITASTNKIAREDQWGDDNRGPFGVYATGQGMVIGEHVSNVLTLEQPPDDACGLSSYAVTPEVPDAPIMELAARASATSATVVFDAPGDDGGSAITGYTATSTPGSFTGTGAGSPITVSGLTTGTPYTFKVKATNAVGNSADSAASNSVTP